MNTRLRHVRPASGPPRCGPAFARLRARRRRQIIKQIQHPTAENADLISTFRITPLWLRKALAPRRRGAPFGNRNALKTGRHTIEIRALKAVVWVCLCQTRALLKEVAPLISKLGANRAGRPRPSQSGRGSPSPLTGLEMTINDQDVAVLGLRHRDMGR